MTRPVTTDYDPALIAWFVYNLRYVAANISYECKACGCSSCADCECALRHAERDRYTRAADQLEAARREVDKANGYADGWNKRCQELQERNAEDEREFSRALTQLAADRDRWRESRRAAMEAGEILKTERDALRAEVEHLTTAAQLSRSGAAEAVRDHDRLVNENEPAIALSDAIDVYRVSAVGELPSATRELANEIRRLQDALDLAARHTPFSPEPCPLCIHAGATCAMHRHIDSLGESVVRQLGRIAELETGPREACAIAGNTTKE